MYGVQVQYDRNNNRNSEYCTSYWYMVHQYPPLVLPPSPVLRVQVLSEFSALLLVLLVSLPVARCYTSTLVLHSPIAKFKYGVATVVPVVPGTILRQAMNEEELGFEVKKYSEFRIVQ